MEASWAKKGMKSNKHESRKARLVPKATTFVEQLFFFSLSFQRSNLALHVFAAVISYVRGNNVQMRSTR